MFPTRTGKRGHYEGLMICSWEGFLSPGSVACGAGWIFAVEAVLCTAGCSATSRVSTHRALMASLPSHDNQSLQTLPNIPPPGMVWQNSPCLRIPVLGGCQGFSWLKQSDFPIIGRSCEFWMRRKEIAFFTMTYHWTVTHHSSHSKMISRRVLQVFILHIIWDLWLSGGGKSKGPC